MANIYNALNIVPSTWEVYNKYFLLLSQPKISKFYVVKENAELWLMFCNLSGSYLSTFDSSVTCLIHFPSEKLRGIDLPLYSIPTLLQQSAIM